MAWYEDNNNTSNPSHPTTPQGIPIQGMARKVPWWIAKQAQPSNPPYGDMPGGAHGTPGQVPGAGGIDNSSQRRNLPFTNPPQKNSPWDRLPTKFRDAARGGKDKALSYKQGGDELPPDWKPSDPPPE